MSFFWPTNTQAYPSVLARLGRLLHWGGLALGGLALWAFVNPAGPDSPATGVFYGVVIYFLGRLMRYMLAGE